MSEEKSSLEELAAFFEKAASDPEDIEAHEAFLAALNAEVHVGLKALAEHSDGLVAAANRLHPAVSVVSPAHMGNTQYVPSAAMLAVLASAYELQHRFSVLHATLSVCLANMGHRVEARKARADEESTDGDRLRSTVGEDQGDRGD